MRSSDYWVAKLDLLPHPEGGFYKETYRSNKLYMRDGDGATRNVSTGIYFLLNEGGFSAFHRIKSDEMWHFHDGGGLNIHVIHPDGRYELMQLGLDLEKGQLPQLIVPAHAWFASENIQKDSFTLVGCTVAPGFDFRDFELASQEELIRLVPSQEELIERLVIR
ncbi:MAG: cupin domain-containing protein [Reichenbachiella sp.]